jgi:hypothetical protein
MEPEGSKLSIAYYFKRVGSLYHELLFTKMDAARFGLHVN